MIKSFKNIVLSFVAAIAIAGALPAVSYADYGANIVSSNCNPSADVARDSTKAHNDLKSCIGQDISVFNAERPFKVRVKFKPDEKFIAMYVAVNIVPLAIYYSVSYLSAHAGAVTAATAVCCSTVLPCNPICALPPAIAGFNQLGVTAGIQAVIIRIGLTAVVAVATNPHDNVDPDGDAYIKIGEAIGLYDLGFGAMARAEVRVEGDKACVYMTSLPIPFLNFKADRTDDFNTNYSDETNPSLPSHCVYMPVPNKTIKPPVPAFISQACIDYDTSASQFRWPPDGDNTWGKSRSFTGVVVQCVEDTMNNLFFNKHNGASESVFVKTQKKLTDMLMAMLALYVVFIGYKLIIERKIKQEEAIWMGLRVGLVMYFAAGAGMTNLLPGIIGSVKNASAIIMDAGAGSTTDNAAKKAEFNSALSVYTAAMNAYSTARIRWAQAASTADKAANKVIMDDARIVQDEAKSVMERARVASLSFGYNYCDFRPFVAAGKYNVPVKAEDGTNVIRDMSYMHLWDSIDCRISRYLGVGVDAAAPSTPKILLIGIGSIFSSVYGIMIFILITAILIFLTLIIVRIVHIYIMAFMAIILLVYISPLVIPMVLFNYTKSSFEAWFRQLLGFCVQPIILFAFLAFMFAIMDSVIYSNNYEFLPVDKSALVATPKIDDNSIARVHGDNKALPCADQNADGCVYRDTDALGYLYQRVNIDYWDLVIKEATVFRVYHTTGLDEGQYKTLMVELIKLFFVCFIIHALLGQVEGMSKTLTNVAGGGATGLSSVPTANPGKIAEGPIAIVKAGGKAAVWAGDKLMKNTVGRAKKARKRS